MHDTISDNIKVLDRLHKTDTDLSKIKFDHKRQEIIDILHASNPVHDKRLWLAGFLQYVGYSESQICDIIRYHNRWIDYNSRETARQVKSVISRIPRHRQNLSSPADVRAPAAAGRTSANYNEYLLSSQKTGCPLKTAWYRHGLIYSGGDPVDPDVKDDCFRACRNCKNLVCLESLQALNTSLVRNRNNCNHVYREGF